MDEKQRRRQNSISLMAVATVSKLIGMFREVALARCWGTTNVSDAYLIASAIPTILFYFIGHALTTAYLPMYNKVRSERGEKDALAYSNCLLTYSLILGIIIVSCLLLFPTTIVKVFAAGFDDETVNLTSLLITISAVSLLLMIVISVLSGFLQAHGRFVLPAFVSIPRNIALILSIFLSVRFSPLVLGIGILCAYAAEFLLLSVGSSRHEYHFRFSFHYERAVMNDTIRVVIPIFVGVGVGQINKVIDRSVATTVISGGVSALTYASIINTAVQEILVTGIITILFANCSRWVSEDKHELVKTRLCDTICTLVFVLIPGMCGIILLGVPIVKCILARGVFDAESVKLTSEALCCYAVGLPFLAFRDTFVKVFYAYRDTKFPTIVSSISIVINILLNLLLSKIWGINGLAIATSFSAMVNCIALFFGLIRKIGNFGLKEQGIVVTKSAMASAIMCIAVLGVRFLLEQSQDILQLVLCTITGAITYGVFSLIIKNQIAIKWVNALKSWFSRRTQE